MLTPSTTLQNEQNEKNLLPGETIVQTSNQGIYTPSPASTQISSTQSSFNHSKFSSKSSEEIKKKYLDRAFLTRRGKSPAQNPGNIFNLLDNILPVNSPVLC